MKKILALAFLLLGLLPIIIQPQIIAANSDSRAVFEAQCSAELGFMHTGKEIASDLFLLRRCITLKLAHEQQLLEAERIQQRSDQTFWKNYDFGQAILQESRRSLQERIQEQGDMRSSFYLTVSVQERAQVLKEQRRKVRTDIRLNEQSQEQERRRELESLKKTMERCRTYFGELRYACLRGEI